MVRVHSKPGEVEVARSGPKRMIGAVDAMVLEKMLFARPRRH